VADTRREHGPEGTQSWKEILAEAFTTFFLNPPKDAKEALRRFAVTIALVMLSGGSYILIREPKVIQAIVGSPVGEQTLSVRIDTIGKDKVSTQLEEWFFVHRPLGLALVAWDELNFLNVIWSHPAAELKEGRLAIQMSPMLRDWIGSFVYGECKISNHPKIPSAKIIACPINTVFSVWGYVAAVYDPSEMTDGQALVSTQALARGLTQLLY
jgi:hypothetical protein